MREATHEEQQSVNDYVDSISVDIGVNFFKDHSKNQQEKHRNPRRKSCERSERSERRKGERRSNK